MIKRILVLSSLLLGVSHTAHAQLVGGDALAVAHDQVIAESRASLSVADLKIGEVATGFSLNFTPRKSAGVSLLNRFETGVGELGMRLSVSGVHTGKHLAPEHSIHAKLTDDSSLSMLGNRMVIGGALQYQEFELGSGYLRADMFGRETDLWTAHMGYGGLRAGLAFGQHSHEDEPRNVMMLNTGLDASSWLKLFGDVAVAQGETQESIAVGRVGVRLNF